MGGNGCGLKTRYANATNVYSRRIADIQQGSYDWPVRRLSVIILLPLAACDAFPTAFHNDTPRPVHLSVVASSSACGFKEAVLAPGSKLATRCDEGDVEQIIIRSASGLTCRLNAVEFRKACLADQGYVGSCTVRASACH